MQNNTTSHTIPQDAPNHDHPWHAAGTVMAYLLRPRNVQLMMDVLACVVSFLTYQWIRGLILVNLKVWLLPEYLLVAGVTAIYWFVLYWIVGLYRDWYVRPASREFATILRATLFGALIIFAVIFSNSPESFQHKPRFIFLIYFVLQFVCMVLARMLARYVQRFMREKGIVQIPALLVGTRSELHSLMATVNIQPELGYQILGAVTIDGTTNDINGVRVLGAGEDLGDIIVAYKPSDVLLAGRNIPAEQMMELTATCTDSDVSVKIDASLYSAFSGQVRALRIYGAPLIDVSPELLKPWEQIAKRTLDIVVSIFFLIVGMPIWIIVGLLIKLTSRGPMIYSQIRIGRNGQEFRIYKFRSMYEDTNRGPSWTEHNDPRVTPLGRFIRKTHLDEAPQLINVLSGEMSLVGPRPEVPFFVEKFTKLVPHYRRRHKIRPGLTGWWQVKARSNAVSLQEIEQRIMYDFYYIEHMSFKLDLEILVRTFFVMVRGHGKA